MKNIHHTCRCTGQQFTFKEWCAWLDKHEKAGRDSGKFVALSYNGFDFNIHDVCITPNRPSDYSTTIVSWRLKRHSRRTDAGITGWMSTCIIRAITSELDSLTMRKKDTQRKPPRFLPLCSMPANQPNANWRTASVAPGRILITRTTKTDSSKTARWLHAFEISSSKSTINAGQRRSNN